MVLLKDIGERQLIKDFRSFIRTAGVVGPGDDAAILDGGIVITTDSVSFKRHFPKGMTYEQFGWYAAAVNFSDLAAMGARPTGILAALSLDEDMESQDVYDIMSGISQCAEFCQTGIVGGDTKPGYGTVACTAIGSMDGRKPMLRSGAKPGDLVAVTGPVGGPAAGLAAIEYGIDNEDAKNSLYLPVPRVETGMKLASLGLVTSCIDLSDGLGTAANILCEDSGVGMDIGTEFVPVSGCVKPVSKETGIPVFDLIFRFGGEYELLFTFGKDRIDELHSAEIDFSVIGMVNDSGKAEAVKGEDRREIGYGRY